jgi:hypothetical protein
VVHKQRQLIVVTNLEAVKEIDAGSHENIQTKAALLTVRLIRAG